ncbi:ribbon-helix-helix domain-containing protein [Sphingomonas sp. BK069]|uniref:ribbon-helix-helix domain-containing protein n=1 Tax=Sphingomonas sp. BK069 TaxID=2586979 RepID=UPI00160DBBE8|nr:ribbon-helix-helix domain-containing protein [Sphingomonas sp. BK069]MBB3345967.1 hypothetical protein [Sphingomonas sp. BK069]
MSRFSGMKEQRSVRSKPIDPAEVSGVAAPAPSSSSRRGKKAVSAYFSPEVSRALNVLAAENETTLQALMGEAIDLLMRQYGRHPFGER